MKNYKCNRCGHLLIRIQKDISGSLQYRCNCGINSPVISYAQDELNEYYSIIKPWLEQNAKEVD